MLLLCSLINRGQSLELKVSDEAGEPIVNAHVRHQSGGVTTFSLTDYEGKVSITNAGGKGVLVISHIGFENKEISLDDSLVQLEIVLKWDKEALKEVVITGQAKEVLASQAVRTINIISRERIEQQAAVNLRDLLTNDLNFRLSEDAVLGSQLSIGGLGGQKIKILVDGVPVIGRLDGNIDLNQINLNDIERVEVVQGPMSVQYGTDAIAGTINLITKKNFVKKAKTSLNTYYETVGRYNVDGELLFPLGKVSGRLSLGRNYFDGFDLEDRRDLLWNPKEQYFARLSLQKRSKKSLWGYSLDYFDEEIVNKGDVGNIDSLVVPIPDTVGAYKYPRAVDDIYRTIRLNNAIRYQHFFEPDMTFKIHLAHNYYRRVKTSDIINLNTLETSPFGGEDAQDTTVFQTYNSRGFFDGFIKRSILNYQLGFEVNHEESKGRRIEGGLKDITDAALFASLHYNIGGDITLEPGFRYAYNSEFETPLIFSFAGRYTFHPRWSLRASYGKGFRAPTLKELYFFFVDENHNILGNQDLKAESSDNFQMTLKYERKPGQAAGRRDKWKYNASLAAFFNDITDEIRLISVIEPDNADPRGLFTNVNIARTQTAGINLQSSIDYGEWSTELGIALTGVKNNIAFSEDAAVVGQGDFLFYPQYRVNLHREFSKHGIVLSLFLNHTGVRKDLIYNSDDELSIISFGDFTMTDFTVGKSLFNKTLNLSLGVKNIFDVTNITSNIAATNGAHSAGSTSFPVRYGRTYFARVKINFGQ